MVRHKNRYMVVEVNEIGKTETSVLDFKEASLYDSILKKVQQLHGDYGVAAIRAGFTAKYCNKHTKIAVIRTRKGPHKLVASALPCIKDIQDKSVIVRTLYVGATIRQCFFFIKSHQQRKFDEYCETLKTEDEKVAMKEAMLSFENVLLKL